MMEVHYTQLVPGETYWIQGSGNTEYPEFSYKKIGNFMRLEGNNPIFARFNNLHDVPGAKLPSGMGSVTENYFSTLRNKFFLPRTDEIMAKSLLRQRIGTPHFNIGGKKRKPNRRRKTNKNKNKKTKKTNTRKRM